jgi:hypothetical protein
MLQDALHKSGKFANESCDPVTVSRSEKPTVRRGRGKNAEYRQREYLTEEAGRRRWGQPQSDPRPAADPDGLPACATGE